MLAVAPQSPAQKAGLKGAAAGEPAAAADRIVAVDGQPVDSPQKLSEAIGKHAIGDPVKLLVLGGGGSFREVRRSCCARRRKGAGTAVKAACAAKPPLRPPTWTREAGSRENAPMRDLVEARRGRGRGGRGGRVPGAACSYSSQGQGAPSLPSSGGDPELAEHRLHPGAQTSLTALSCTMGAESCCALGGGGSATASCITNGQNCAGTTFSCVEAANCPAGQVCCGTSADDAGAGAAFQCQSGTTCPNGEPQSCRTNAECAAVQTSCIVQTCDGIREELCGTAPASGCSGP